MNNQESGDQIRDEKAQGDGLSFKEAKVVNRGDY